MGAGTQPERMVGGRYRLIGWLATGGMGKVWRAHDEQLGVDVAVKELRLDPGASDQERDKAVAYARREAHNAARLRDHPNVVAVHDVVEDAGSPWLVMRLVQGRSLANAIEERGRLHPGEVGRIAAGVLAALGAAHAAGIVHRDIKPGNVMLADDGAVLVTDFGIAVHHADPKLTTTGAVIGSFEYAAPERLDGKEGPAGDLFSLGVAMYEAAEGISPFRRGTVTATIAAVAGEIPPPPQRPGPLAPLITQLMEKDPLRRPSANAALAALSGTPGPTSWPPRVSIGWLASGGVDLTGHTDRVYAVAFSPDGKTLASSAKDKSVRLWDVESGRQTAALTEDNKFIFAVAFSPDGRTLASGMSKAVGLWDVATGRLAATLAHIGLVVSVAFSPDGKTLATCMPTRKTVCLWDVTAGREVTTLAAPAPLSAVAFSPDGQTLAAACDSSTRGWNGTIRLWDVNAGPSFRDLSGTEAKPVPRVNSVAFSPDGRTLAASGAHGAVLWDVATGREVATLGSDPVTIVAFSADGQTLAARAGRRTQLFDLASRQARTLDVPTSWRQRDSVAFSPDGRSLAVPGHNVIRLWSDRS